MNDIDKLCETLDALGVSYERGKESRTGFDFVKFSFGEYGRAYMNMEFGVPWISVGGDVASLSGVAEAILGRRVEQ